MLTIFTPTYNRETLLHKLYESLKVQTSFDFEWLIVDDGSIDNTEAVVNVWVFENVINIRYIRQENGGKHTAFNCGVKNALGELFFCVDSDDYVPPDCVETILNLWNDEKGENIAGIIALKSDFSGNLICNIFPDKVPKISTYDLEKKYNCGGDKALVYRTSILKQYPYPEISGETFIGECVLYDKIALKYKMLLLNKVLTICEYQADGLTANIFPTMLKNPTGYKIYYNQRIDMAYTLKERLGYIIRYCAFDILSKDKKYNYKGNFSFLIWILMPLGWLLTKYYNYKKESE